MTKNESFAFHFCHGVFNLEKLFIYIIQFKGERNMYIKLFKKTIATFLLSLVLFTNTSNIIETPLTLICSSSEKEETPYIPPFTRH